MQYIIYSVALLLYLLCLSSPQLPSPCSEDHYRLISKKILQSTDIPKPSTKYNSPFTPHHSLRHDIHDHHLIGTYYISIYLVDSRAIHSRHSSPIQLFWASVVRCTWMVLIGCWVFTVVLKLKFNIVVCIVTSGSARQSVVLFRIVSCTSVHSYKVLLHFISFHPQLPLIMHIITIYFSPTLTQ